MALSLTTIDICNYYDLAHDRIFAQKDYITALDSATGDGDHWVNINSGLEKVCSMRDELSKLSLSDAFRKIGMTFMSVIGGSSGILFGSAYVEASKVLMGKDEIDFTGLCAVLEAQLNGITKRGGAVPGMKTMIDSIDPAVKCFKDCIANKTGELESLQKVKKAAEDGAEATKDMEAIRGRASYQANKGIGNLDPGAISMSILIGSMMDYAVDQLA
jgi:dihydroxyacetone kinase-like protein